MSHLLCKENSQVWSYAVCSAQKGLGMIVDCLGGVSRRVKLELKL